jgi:hypothetical protein
MVAKRALVQTMRAFQASEGAVKSANLKYGRFVRQIANSSGLAYSRLARRLLVSRAIKAETTRKLIEF